MSASAQLLGSVRQAFASGHMAQAYVLAGSPREGGLDLATGILGLLFCESGGSDGVCPCPACRQIAERRHPDVLWVEPQKKSRVIGIDQVRELRLRMQQTAFGGGWKACVLAGADRLGPEASNAILKTLEEPAPHTLFLLLTENPQRLLPTIRSRCQVMRLPEVLSVQNEWTSSLLEILQDAHTPGAEARSVISEVAHSHRISALFKAMKEAAEEQTAAEAGTTAEQEEKDTLAARTHSLYREWRSDVMRALLVWYRDVLLLVSGADRDAVFHAEQVDVLQGWADGISYRQALTNVRTVDEMHLQLERNLPESLVFAYGLGRLF